ncbi:Uncharacterised protein [Kluyvera ascorbata]|nr:hypothetical protein STW0522KLE44_46900 [Klebsiella sp. STW0522-44]STW96612.1 Uncharacterised protein [Kluyvera ascorbata]
MWPFGVQVDRPTPEPHCTYSRRRFARPGYMGERLTCVTHTRSNARDGDHQRLLNVMVWFLAFFFRFT